MACERGRGRHAPPSGGCVSSGEVYLAHVISRRLGITLVSRLRNTVVRWGKLSRAFVKALLNRVILLLTCHVLLLQYEEKATRMDYFLLNIA